MQNSRRLARQCAVQALYQWRITAQASARIEADFIDNKNLTGHHREYFRRLIRAIPEHIEEIDALIAPHLDREMRQVDLLEHAILRLGTYELNYARDIPTKAVLDEAIELAKLFCAAHGYKYVNGVLDKVAKAVRGDAQ